MKDWELIEAYRAGDEDAFATLVQRYYSLVYGAACRQVSDTHLAEDVTQCVFLLFARKIKALSPETAIGGWFLRTVRFVGKDAVRKSRRWQRFENDEVLIENMARPTFDAVGPLASLEEAILALPEKEQTCLLAKYYEGKSLKEIGADLNISQDAAEKRVARGLEKMRTFFQRRGLKVSTTTIPMVLSAGFLMAKGTVPQSGPVTVLAAVKGKTISAGVSAMVQHVANVMAWKHWLITATKVALVLMVAGVGTGWVLVNREPAVPPAAGFQLNDPRVEVLGKTWSQVMQRAATVRHEFPTTPTAEDRRLPALREENKSLFRDRMALSQGLRALDQESSARIFLPGYVASGLGELLHLSQAQRAFVFNYVQQTLPRETKELEASGILETNKPLIVSVIREKLSIRQRWSFDRVCGRNGEFLLINRTAYGRAPGYIAWQDWLGGGGILTPEEAMETVPPELW